MDWTLILNWVHATTITMLLPVFMVTELLHITNAVGLGETIMDCFVPRGSGGPKGDVSMLFFAPIYMGVLCMVYWLWWGWTVFFYGGLLSRIIGVHPVDLVYSYGPYLFIGALIGWWVAWKLLCAIDDKLGFEPGHGISGHLGIWRAMGAAYMGIKLAKVMAKVVKKI